jgi:nucleotide-binding universal stress UspA family protein
LIATIGFVKAPPVRAAASAARQKGSTMYKHLLVPIDGSPLSMKAARRAVGLAQTLGARLLALHVIAPFVPPYTGDAVYLVDLVTEKDYLEGMRRYAAKLLGKVESLAAKASVPCTAESAVFPTPWEGIIKTASKRKCDLIVMSSHGRGGLAGIVLGSQAQRVLTHSKIPVLVCR